MKGRKMIPSQYCDEVFEVCKYITLHDYLIEYFVNEAGLKSDHTMTIVVKPHPFGVAVEAQEFHRMVILTAIELLARFAEKMSSDEELVKLVSKIPKLSRILIMIEIKNGHISEIKIYSLIMD